MRRLGRALGMLTVCSVLGCGASGGPCSLTDAGSPLFQCAGSTPETLTDLWNTVLRDAGVGGCAVAGCHLPRPAGTSPTDYSTIAATALNVGLASQYGHGLKVVDPNNLANSTLWLKVLGGSPTYQSLDCTGVGPLMPSGAAGPMNAAALAKIKGWICAGAPAQ